MRFVRDHLGDPGWFQSGTYARFDQQAQNILDGTASAFWIDDPTRTDAAVYPPGYSLWVALIYKLTGDRSAEAVQIVQWVLDALSVLLIVGVGATAFNFRVGLTAGFLAALAPVLALNGATPLADAPTSWLILAGVWLLLLAWKKQKLWWALGAGAFVGASCWLRANALLLVFVWAVVLFLMLRGAWQLRLRLSLGVILGAALFIAPLLVRNTIAFRAFVPTGLGMGTNLWEGIGETERAAEFGAVIGDTKLVEQERKELGLGPDAPLTLYSPNGVERDRARTRKALRVIAAHPLWYSGVMLKRMWGMLKFAGEPIPYYGSMGINITSRKTLPSRVAGKSPRGPGCRTGNGSKCFPIFGVAINSGRFVLRFPLAKICDVAAVSDCALLFGSRLGATHGNSLRTGDAVAATRLCSSMHHENC